LEGGFRHYEQSLRVVDKLEHEGKGLNLTDEVRDGILKHSKGIGPIIPKDDSWQPITLEGQIVRISDIVAYVNHDIDDAIRATMITRSDIPQSTQKLLGKTFAKRIDTIVLNIIDESLKNNLEFISISKDIYEEICKLRDFLYEKVYLVKESPQELEKIRKILHSVYQLILEIPEEYINPFPAGDPVERRAIDFIAGMTDRYVMNIFRRITFPANDITGLLY
jgi:dGTPase